MPGFESKGRELFGLPQARQALRETDTAIVPGKNGSTGVGIIEAFAQ